MLAWEGMEVVPLSVDPVELSCRLMSFPSVSPDHSGSMEFLSQVLADLGFRCEILVFGSGEIKVKNLYAQLGNEGTRLCFAGHTDVVPPGDLTKWKFPPFSPTIEKGALYGRGASDMKAAICAFIAAVSQLSIIPGSISLLLTGDEEGMAYEYGTKSVLHWMGSQKIKIDYCIVGEPTSSAVLGDIVKVGRRGCINFLLQCHGIQGHVAYPELARNPINDMVRILHIINSTSFDNGNEYFQPSNCEITSVDVGNKATNVIPDSVRAQMNVRFSSENNATSLHRTINEICSSVTERYSLSHQLVGEAFFSKPDERATALLRAIKEVTNQDAAFSTSGGTSDARFIKDFCPTIEFGLLNSTAHQTNEHVPVSDIQMLSVIYKKFIENFFAHHNS